MLTIEELTPEELKYLQSVLEETETEETRRFEETLRDTKADILASISWKRKEKEKEAFTRKTLEGHATFLETLPVQYVTSASYWLKTLAKPNNDVFLWVVWCGDGAKLVRATVEQVVLAAVNSPDENRIYNIFEVSDEITEL
jgi:hypothetical protein